MTARRSVRTTLLCVLLSVFAVAQSGCGVPVDRSARVTDPDDVPFELLDSTTTTVVAGNPEGLETSICLAIDSSLLAVGRDRAGQPPLDSLLSLVLAGPTEGEAKLGLRSALTGDDPVTAVNRAGSTAMVELGSDFADLPADQQLLAVAQITCTMTTQPGIERVTFLLDDTQLEVPVQGGSLVARAVTRSDYADLLAN